ncbi:enoyl-CoA hydratase domain-containing protein 3, mitochondrial [Venturia canescens]|uniref:enoyl-CoA hydratase domain-containing protein 3, mitochondrial n=1 Tax=Venturia canescens TaxID=32260 RepID=UPI001C9C9097|nr:enoyl-CoA hydratase domain-containing protein 3, mitochondrial [Venturia canescens]
MSLSIKKLILATSKLGRCVSRNYAANATVEYEKYVETTEDNGVKTIKLCHASTRNSLSLEMMKIILWNITRDEDRGSLRSIVITADPGKVFSAGHNLKELTSEQGGQYHRDVFATATELMKAIANSPVPIIAAVDGLAAAAGCQLVSACDIAVCTERSTFSTPGANFGIFCSTPGVPLVRNIPRKVASHMLFTGLPITAKEARAVGLVSKVTANEDLAAEVKTITDAITSKSRAVVSLGKKFLYEQLDLDYFSAYELGAEIMVNNLELKDAQEGIRGFVEKRKPVWGHDFKKDK